LNDKTFQNINGGLPYRSVSNNDAARRASRKEIVNLTTRLNYGLQ